MLVLISAVTGQEVNITNCPEIGKFSEIANIWMLIAASLVFFMNAGFAMLEAGFCRRNNAVNVLAKNLIVFCVATLAFWLFGFRFMFGDSQDIVFGSGFWPPIEITFPDAADINPFPNDFNNLQEFWGSRSFAALFFFQLVFAGTAATIVSGALAERIKFWAFLLFSFCLVAFIYPLTGYWVWGSNGWLSNSILNFHDFAGATVVHSVGGVAGLTGAWLLKPRDGKFGYNASEKDFSGTKDTKDFTPHNLGFATLGCLILWLGWFGFNGGSTRFIEYVPYVMTTTMMSAAAGGMVTLFISYFLTGAQVKLGTIVNGILGGLVSITASSAYVDMTASIFIGFSGGIVVILGEYLVQRVWRIDDPVGAVPVHLFCGGWGTIAVALFGDQISCEYSTSSSMGTQFLFQFIGWGVIVAIVGLLSSILWILIGLLLSLIESFFNNDLSYFLEKITQGSAIDCLRELIKTGREGIRVSLENEESGKDDAIENEDLGLITKDDLEEAFKKAFNKH
jgi:Amt family ammonium transporter